MSGALNHSPAEIIRQMLIDLGHGTDPEDSGAWPIYVAHTPSSPDSAITVIDTSAIQDGREMITGQRQEHPGFQIGVRAANHQTGYVKAKAIAIALDEDVKYTGVTVSATTYIVYAVSRSSDVLALGKETPNSKRDLFTINATASLRQTS